jgi:hypothetical protein
VIDELRYLVDDGGHLLILVRLIHDGHRVPHVHAMHAVNHVTGVLSIKSVSRPADFPCGVHVGVGLLAQRIGDL